MKNGSAINLLFALVKQKSKKEIPGLIDYIYGYAQLLGMEEAVLKNIFSEKDFEEYLNVIKIFNKNEIDVNLIKQGAFILCSNDALNIDISELIESSDGISIDDLLEKMITTYPYIKNIFYEGKDIAEVIALQQKNENIFKEKIVEKKQIKNTCDYEKSASDVNPYEKLNNLIGLEEIKRDVNSLINLMKMQIRRKNQGFKQIPVSLHLVFSGNPGTGKTTIARILAKIYKDIGVLSKGQLIEVDRSGLVAGYVGQTALKTQEKINEALGGILFVDEAYTLAKNNNDDYGQEAIDTILKAMEDYRNDFIVIVAGYTELMKKFINSNPGLRSRFNKYINFPDYSAEELVQIFKSMCEEYQYELTEDAEKIMTEKLYYMEANKDENFANARDVRNMFEEVITNQATRLAENLSGDIMKITAEDFS